MSITLSEAMNRYKFDRNNCRSLEDKILETCTYLDAVITKLSQDPLGKQCLEKAKIEVNLMFAENSGYKDLLQTKYIGTFKSIQGFSDKYFVLYSNSMEEAEAQADKLYPELWNDIHLDEESAGVIRKGLKQI